MSIRLYVTLLKHSDSQIEYKKLILMVETTVKISMLKRKIEQEFTELFPIERPFICGKVDDQYGYSLSNTSFVGDLLKNDDRIVAVPDENGPGFISAHDTHELLSMLSTIQENIVGKLSEAAVVAHQPPEELILSILPLGFTQNPATLHSVCTILTKGIHEGTVRLLDDRSYSNLLSMLITVLQYWVMELMDRDSIVQQAVIDILEICMRSRLFTSSFKTQTIMAKLMNATRGLNTTGKAKLTRIIAALSKGEAYEAPARREEPRWEQQNISEPVPAQAKRESLLKGQSRERHQDPAPNPNRYEAKIQSQNPSQPPRFDSRDQNRGYQTRLPETEMGRMIADYIEMLSPSNTLEMICFGLHNLETVMDEALDISLENSDLFLKLFGLIEIPVPANYENLQYQLLKGLSTRITRARAEDAAQQNGLSRLVKAYNEVSSKLQIAVIDLLEQLLKLGKRTLDIPSLIAVSLSPYQRINEVGMRALATLADPGESQVPDAIFENHIRFFIGACTSDKASSDYRNAAAACLAGLSLRDYLKPQIEYCGGINTLIYLLRDSNIDGQRMAAKALVNLTSTKRDLRLKIIAELSDEIKKMYRNELDSVVAAYLQTLVQGR
ncbi:unnamed protein product [Blepharisma stoltei]|uniref:TOG domain-containing protein n=1 Tax=Blepharisma stoltei TaxID=1481888 RepID=A0AAU9K980_9CILI|nr:unnamed protein product [Blepharisma stoltei]